MGRTTDRYGQLHKPFGPMPYKKASIEGFIPSQPFTIPSHFAQRDFHFPTLAELNNELDQSYPWLDDDGHICYFSYNVVEDAPVMYQGPWPLPAIVRPPAVPPISFLVTSIIDSADCRFFVSHSLGNPLIREWCLICITFADSTAMLPACLQDGKFLVEFYTLHHEDIHQNATNQRYWLQV